MSGTKRDADIMSVTAVQPADTQRNEVAKKRKIELDLELQNFAHFVRSHIPFKFLPIKQAKYLIIQANARIALAVKLGIELKNLYIGMDCVPEWRGFVFDPSSEDLGVHIQGRLMDYEASKEIRFLRNELIELGNKRLEEAVSLGLRASDLFIGDDLLPRWDNENENDNDDATSSVVPPCSTEPPVTTMIPDYDDFVGGHYASSCSENENENDSESNSDTDTDTDTEPEFKSKSVDGNVSLNNLVDPDPIYEDLCSGEYTYTGTENIFHDAEVVGAPPGFGLVDLEVYLVNGDDSDLDDIPEMEMGIDRLAFELYYDTDEAVDIEMPGVEVRCSTDLPGAGHDEQEQEHGLDIHIGGHQQTRQYTQSHTRSHSQTYISRDDSGCFVLSSDEGSTDQSEEE